MDHGNMEYWQPSNTFAHGSHLYDSYDMSSNSSMSASPVSSSPKHPNKVVLTSPQTMSEFELFPPPLYNSPFSPVPEDMGFNYPMPLTPSDFGSPEDAPLYSPRSSVAMPVPHAPAEKTHATSGVSFGIIVIKARD